MDPSVRVLGESLSMMPPLPTSCSRYSWVTMSKPVAVSSPAMPKMFVSLMFKTNREVSWELD